MSLTVTKTAGVPQVEIEGDDVTFTFTVTNTSLNDAVIVSLEDDKFGTLDGDADCQVGTVLAAGETCEFEDTFFVEPDEVADPPSDTDPHVNTFTACIERDSGEGEPVAPTVCAEDTATVGFGGGSGGGGGDGGGGGGGGGKQPPTDMLLPTDSVAATNGGLFGGVMSWIAWLALSAGLIVSAGWVIRRQRFSEI